MIRLTIYFVIVGVLSALAAWFANNPGDVIIHWQAYEIQTSVGVLVVGTALLALFGYGLVRTVRLVIKGPAAFAARRAQRRKARRLHMVVKGFAAAAIGDGDAAKKALKFAQGGDDLEGLTRLLSAQVAEIERDEDAVEAAYRELLKDPDTEFLGLRGLYEAAIRLGDREAALAFATRAFEARPRSLWLADQLFRVQTQSGAWELAKKTIAVAKRSDGLSADQAKRREGVVLAAEALAAEAAGDHDKAYSQAHRALSLAPGLVPMAVLVAKHQAAEGQTWRAAGTIETAWRIHPHPDLAATYATLKTGETPTQKARRMMGLAEFNPNHVESRLLVANEALALGEARRARRALRPALDVPSARVLMLMSEISAKTGGGEAEAQAFRARAIAAPRDGQWFCRDCGRERADWAPVCDSCGGFDSYAWGTQGGLAGITLIASNATHGALDWQEDLAEAAPLVSEGEPGASGEGGEAAEAKPEIPEAPATPSPPPPPPETVETPLKDVFVPPRQPDDPGTEELEEDARQRGFL